MRGDVVVSGSTCARHASRATEADVTEPLSDAPPGARAARTLTGTAPSADLAARPSKAAQWTGRILSGLVVLFLLMDGVMKLAKPPFVVDATVELGYPEGVIVGLGVVLVVSTILYAIPRTAVLGAVLLTGYLGGAVATHVRVGQSLFGHVLFPTYLGAMLWLGLYLRDPRLRALMPLRRPQPHP
jgi:hypothetical protein